MIRAPAPRPFLQILEELGDDASLAMVERPTSESASARFRLHSRLGQLAGDDPLARGVLPPAARTVAATVGGSATSDHAAAIQDPLLRALWYVGALRARGGSDS